MNKKIKIVLSGIGNRALPRIPETSNWLGWVELIRRSDEFELVAAHDPQEVSLKRLIDHNILRSNQVYQNLDEMLENSDAEAMLVANPAESHFLTMAKGLARNLHILVEKPLVSEIDDGKNLIKQIRAKKLIVSVVQNWRYKDTGRLLNKHIQDGLIGSVDHIFFRYVRNRENPGYPEYIFKEKYPLLYAMGIHHLDLFRFILQDEYESVSANSFKPAWSLYKHDTGMNIFLKTKKGVSVIYSGTFSSKNSLLPQESLLIEGDRGSLFNESQWLEPPLWLLRNGSKEKLDLAKDIPGKSVFEQYNHSDEIILKNFYNAITGKEKPLCPAEDALNSVIALEACRLSAETKRTLRIIDVNTND